LRLRATSGWQALDLYQLWHYRDLLTVLASRDVKLRYRQTALGVVWVLLQPLLAAGIFAFVFGKVARLPSAGLPYFVFSYAGLLGWNVFNSTVTKAGSAMVGNANLVSKVYFPRLVLPLATVFSTLIDFGVALAMMVVLMVVYHVAPHPGLVLLPAWLILLLMLSMGIGLVAAALTVSYRDVQYVLPVMLPFVMYASPVAYDSSAVPAKLRIIYYLNPVSGLLDGFRWSVLHTASPAPAAVAYSSVFAVVMLLAGAFMFRRMERRFADVI
jgi:lipopolysaccharide transport system permease protein